jgi:hypothetical protein
MRAEQVHLLMSSVLLDSHAAALVQKKLARGLEASAAAHC